MMPRAYITSDSFTLPHLHLSPFYFCPSTSLPPPEMEVEDGIVNTVQHMTVSLQKRQIGDSEREYFGSTEPGEKVALTCPVLSALASGACVKQLTNICTAACFGRFFGSHSSRDIRQQFSHSPTFGAAVFPFNKMALHESKRAGVSMDSSDL